MPLAVFAITCPDHRKGDFSFCSSTPVGSRAIPCASNRCVGMEDRRRLDLDDGYLRSGQQHGLLAHAIVTAVPYGPNERPQPLWLEAHVDSGKKETVQPR